MLGFVEPSAQTITLTFVQGGKSVEIRTTPGASLLQVAQENGLDVEGACEGNMACATCHMIFQTENFKNIPDPSLEEEEMLDLAVDLTPTSRLGCQVIVRLDMDGWKIRIPDERGAFLGF